MKISGDRESESQRTLDRIARETDGGSDLFSRTARRARDHVSAADKDPGDQMELWGTRIGRLLGLVLLVALIVYLAFFVTGG
jgi:hypothetical protein